jgi:hypothetical protein
MAAQQPPGEQPGDNWRGSSPWARSLTGPDANLAIDRDSAARSLGALVLTVVELLRELMERQAIRRFEQGDLTPTQVEEVGATLMALDERMNELCEHFDLSREDLNLDLGPLGPLLTRD